MNVPTVLKQALTNGTAKDKVESPEAPAPVRELKPLELSLIGGGQGPAHFF